MSTSNRGLRWLALAALISTLGCLAGEWFGAGKEESSTFVQVDGPADEPTAEVEVEEPSPTPPPTPTPAPTDTAAPTVAQVAQPTEIRCEESLPTRLFVGATGVALLEIRVRSEPTRELDVVIGRLYAGDWFEVWDGPECAGGWLWWAIDDGRGLIGWLAESDATRYFVEPLP